MTIVPLSPDKTLLIHRKRGVKTSVALLVESLRKVLNTLVDSTYLVCGSGHNIELNLKDGVTKEEVLRLVGPIGFSREKPIKKSKKK